MTRLWGTRALITLTAGALTAGALVLAVSAAPPANAADGLAFSPGLTNVTTVPIRATSSDIDAAGSYGFTVTGADPSKPLKVVASADLTATSTGTLLIQRTAGGAPKAAGPWITPPLVENPEGRTGTVISATPSATDVYWLATTAPAQYSLTFYQEGIGGDQTTYTADPDQFGAARFDLLSYDLAHHTSSTFDDGTAALQADGPINIGDTLPIKVLLPGVTPQDIRGAGADGQGVLATALRGTTGSNGPVRVQVALGGQPVQSPALTYTGQQTSTFGVTSDVYTGTYGPAPAGGRLTTTLTAGPSFQSTGSVDVGQPVTISVPPKAEGGATVRITGRADPKSKVLVSVRRGAATYFSGHATVTALADGTWSFSEPAIQTTQYRASENGKTQEPATADTVTVYSYLTAKAKALGGGKVQWTVSGHPSVTGYANVFYAGTRIGHVRTSTTGTAVFTVQSSAGRKTFDLYFQAPGCTLEVRHLTGTVK